VQIPTVEQATEQAARDQGAARVAESVRRALLLVGPAEGARESAGTAKRAREATLTAREHL
jgi:hypothetical protein